MSVKGDKVECSVNGTVVGSYDKAAVVGAGKLKSTDGVYGLRFGHNTEVIVTGFEHVEGLAISRYGGRAFRFARRPRTFRAPSSQPLFELDTRVARGSVCCEPHRHDAAAPRTGEGSHMPILKAFRCVFLALAVHRAERLGGIAADQGRSAPHPRTGRGV